MGTKAMRPIVALLTGLLFLTPMAGCISDESDEVKSFPVFSGQADDGNVYDNAAMEGSGFIVIFSAEWCNNPCYTTMHAIWNAEPALPVLVMSTDPAENAGSMTLSDWHASADAYDDDGDDAGVSLTTYAFMKGSEAGKALDITRPGSVVFVNGQGEITYQNEGRMDDAEEIRAKWTEASA